MNRFDLNAAVKVISNDMIVQISSIHNSKAIITL